MDTVRRGMRTCFQLRNPPQVGLVGSDSTLQVRCLIWGSFPARGSYTRNRVENDDREGGSEARICFMDAPTGVPCRTEIVGVVVFHDLFRDCRICSICFFEWVWVFLQLFGNFVAAGGPPPMTGPGPRAITFLIWIFLIPTFGKNDGCGGTVHLSGIFSSLVPTGREVCKLASGETMGHGGFGILLFPCSC
ncbi:hypothetical protein [Pasteuria penetrans]|uniref:hypothetical protein n=1 Tax=Pasteuria penetrans TaxID=86005 RepID=UPI000FC2F4BD|nr:hypothetical protein [Pasteuria penetrans]